MAPQQGLPTDQAGINYERALREQVGKGDKIAAIMIKMVEKWPSSIVARAAVSEITGGVYSRGSMANFDSQGIGPDGSFFVGKQIAYDAWAFAHWLHQKSKLLDDTQCKKKDISSLLAAIRRREP